MEVSNKLTTVRGNTYSESEILFMEVTVVLNYSTKNGVEMRDIVFGRKYSYSCNNFVKTLKTSSKNRLLTFSFVI